jgi:hypothetical protein
MDTAATAKAQANSPGTKPKEESFGFEVAHLHEREGLALNSRLSVPDGMGLALSGGGIRSASFALGVVQSLLNEQVWHRFDYLSTVSGGGYLGAALSWWMHQVATDPDLEVLNPSQRYELFRDQLGSKVLGARQTARRSGPALPERWVRSNWLAYIRQHGSYLRPPGVSVLSLAASALRVCLYSVLVYFAMATGVSLALTHLGDLLDPKAFGDLGILGRLLGFGEKEVDLYQTIGGAGAILTTAVILLTMLAYGPATFLASSLEVPGSFLYEARTKFRRYSGHLLGIALGAFLFWRVDALYKLIDHHSHAAWAWATSSTGLGAIGTIYQFVIGRSHPKTPPSATGNLRVVITAVLVIYGALLGAYAVAHELHEVWHGGQTSLDSEALWTMTGLLCGGSLLLGLLINTNYSGIGRLYRDRLMEAFLPDIDAVASNTWALARTADVFQVAELRGCVGRSRPELTSTSGLPRPLHLINCNVVLLDSELDLYRTRGGDSFTISPLMSGSNATGYIWTKTLGDQAMSLATAMSISGAAANPNAAPNGHGVTKNRLVAFLMSLFSARLGYWLPTPGRHRLTKANRPNLWFPGLRQGLLGIGQHEKATFLELTDGGHFDNTGVYELVRRRTRLIILSEAGYDPDSAMDDLANLIEKVRVDFSVFIDFEDASVGLEGLRPASLDVKTVGRGYAVGRIRYPNGNPDDMRFDDGYLVYLQSVPLATMPADADSYRRQSGLFPNDPTSDQFFDEEALEGYRELGYSIGRQFFADFRKGGNGSVYFREFIRLQAELTDGTATAVPGGSLATAALGKV